MSRLLWETRRQQEADAEAAHAAVDEATARSLCNPPPPLERRAAPIDPPTEGKAA